jgi:spore maturation protein CgeB
MKIVIFGLSVTSAWGNGHATLWRGLIRALAALGHETVFFERDQPFYARARDLDMLPGCRIVIYGDWEEVRDRARLELANADAGIITSFCPDAEPADALLRAASRPLHVVYDLDSPVTLAALAQGERPGHVPADGLGHADLVLSYAGGTALTALRDELGARLVLPLYGSVDPDEHKPCDPDPRFAAGLSYLGTHAPDRQEALQRLFLAPAAALPHETFLLAGAQYPAEMTVPSNVRRLEHVPPGDHAAFYCSARLTLNITRAAMAAVGYCPQGRLFEAAACGAAILSDRWEGIEAFFTPGDEILIVESAADVQAALALPAEELARMGAAARERALTEHTATRRASELEAALELALQQRDRPMRRVHGR